MQLQMLALAALAALALLPAAHADGPTMPRAVPPAYTAECAACHVAYPPGMLPAASWRRILSGLETHYGTDASLDAATVRELGEWLQVNAGTYKRVREQPPDDRITRSAWFVRKHRELAPDAWRLAAVKSAANCAACHGRADQGRFDDDELRMRDGLPAALRRAWNVNTKGTR